MKGKISELKENFCKSENVDNDHAVEGDLRAAMNTGHCSQRHQLRLCVGTQSQPALSSPRNDVPIGRYIS